MGLAGRSDTDSTGVSSFSSSRSGDPGEAWRQRPSCGICRVQEPTRVWWCRATTLTDWPSRVFSCSCSRGFGVPLGPVGVTAARNFTRKRPPDSEVSYQLSYVGQLVKDLMGTWEPVFFTRKRPRRCPGPPSRSLTSKKHWFPCSHEVPYQLSYVGQLVRDLRIWRSLTSKVCGRGVLLTNQKK